VSPSAAGSTGGPASSSFAARCRQFAFSGTNDRQHIAARSPLSSKRKEKVGDLVQQPRPDRCHLHRRRRPTLEHKHRVPVQPIRPPATDPGLAEFGERDDQRASPLP
jgi:hypothetical protein